LGKTAGAGNKGQKSRKGFSRRPGFEGGQMPLHRRLPKRGFTPLDRTEYQVVNLYQLEKLAVDEVTPEALYAAGLIGHARRPVKILGTGDLTRKLSISAHRFSKTAREKIEGLGGTVQEIA
jgi:large subunit ribosomal protein L15